ncbi:MAG: leucyl aminopeptidase [Chloroflexota bacterium]
MPFTTSTEPIQSITTDALIVYVAQDSKPTDRASAVDTALNGAITTVIDDGDFSGKAEETITLYTNGAIPAKRVILVGLGDTESISPDSIRRAAAVGALRARTLNLKSVATYPIIDELSVAESTQALVEGMQLALYQYHGQKSDDAPEDLPEQVIIAADSEADATFAQQGINTGNAFASGTNLARDLINLPPNILIPAYMAQRAEQMAKEVGLACTILEKQQMQALKMGALLGVAQGSDYPPKFIILEHNADKADDDNTPTIVLVGKGVTFDTGGYSLKSRDGMIGMKADMSGGAAVIGAMQTIAQLDVPIHVVGLVPAADNMVSGKAYRPQEVITASNGTTIEIISTDAEGRLLLADALVYAQRYQPTAVLDIATLTGSIVVALGHAATGVYSNSDSIVATLQQAADLTDEYVWRMPMFPDYGKSLKSDTADTKNSGGRGGGAGVAAHFLSNFIDYDWAHVDMAGMLNNDGSNILNPKHSARGYGARLFAEFARQFAQSSAEADNA